MVKAGTDCCPYKPQKKRQVQKVTAGLVAARETSVDAEVLSEQGGYFTLKEEQGMALLGVKDVFAYSRVDLKRV